MDEKETGVDEEAFQNGYTAATTVLENEIDH